MELLIRSTLIAIALSATIFSSQRADALETDQNRVFTPAAEINNLSDLSELNQLEQQQVLEMVRRGPRKTLTPEQVAHLGGPVIDSSLECAYWGPSHHSRVGYRPPASVGQMARSSELVAQGVVTLSSAGLALGEPATLLTIKVNKTWNSDDAEKEFEHLQILYPAGILTVGGNTLCKADDRFPPLPVVGQEIIVFVMHPYVSNDPVPVVLPSPGQVLTISDDNRLTGDEWFDEDLSVLEGRSLIDKNCEVRQ